MQRLHSFSPHLITHVLTDSLIDRLRGILNACPASCRLDPTSCVIDTKFIAPLVPGLDLSVLGFRTPVFKAILGCLLSSFPD